MAGDCRAPWAQVPWMVGLAVCLCGMPPGARAEPVRHVLAPYHRDQTRFRWMDIADNPYSKEFRRRFRYREGQVAVTYTTAEGGVLRGRLVARGLKPNFAYQLKLEGRPSPPGLPGACPLAAWSNAQIGSLGRWWCLEDAANAWMPSYLTRLLGSPAGSASETRWLPAPEDGLEDGGPGAEDEDLDSPGSRYGDYHEGHTLLGYLLFDFFVTDHEGNASHEFAVNSSYHVLWKTTQVPPGPTDGPVRRFTVRGERGRAYGREVGPTQVAIYAEHEFGRPEPGQVRLPPGRYRCRLLLTEESFHAYGGWGRRENLGGQWAHALSDENLEFTVVRTTD